MVLARHQREHRESMRVLTPLLQRITRLVVSLFDYLLVRKGIPANGTFQNEFMYSSFDKGKSIAVH